MAAPSYIVICDDDEDEIVAGPTDERISIRCNVQGDQHDVLEFSIEDFKVNVHLRTFRRHETYTHVGLVEISSTACSARKMVRWCASPFDTGNGIQQALGAVALDSRCAESLWTWLSKVPNELVEIRKFA